MQRSQGPAELAPVAFQDPHNLPFRPIRGRRSAAGGDFLDGVLGDSLNRQSIGPLKRRFQKELETHNIDILTHIDTFHLVHAQKVQTS